MKKLSLFIVLLLISMTLLGGCGGSGDSAAGQNSGEQATELDWPKGNIKIIVPYSAGGGTDLMARTISPYLADILGTSVVVENLTGGSGAVAMNALANSAPDGYTLILTSIGASTLTPNSSDVGYTNKEFAPIAQISDVPNVFCVNKNLGISTWEEYLALAKSKGNITYGSSGAGLTQNIQTESLLAEKNQSGLITHIPFDGGSASMTALLGEQVDATVNIVSECLPYINDGTFIPLWVSSPERDPDLPDTPTALELGYTSVNGGVWYGIAAPAGTNDAIIQKIDATVAETLRNQDVIDTFTNLGTPIDYMNSADFTGKWMENYDTNKAILESINQ